METCTKSTSIACGGVGPWWDQPMVGLVHGGISLWWDQAIAGISP